MSSRTRGMERRSKMANWTVSCLAITSIVVVVSAAGWYRAENAARSTTKIAADRLVADYLRPIESLVSDDEAIIKELEGERNAEKDSGILDSYMARVRRDGVSKNSGMKQRIDALVNNNTAVLALLSTYSTHARTTMFKISADRFRDYSISLRDRWQSVLEIFMAGGALPSDSPAFPTDLAGAIQAEISTYR
jgi:hypothetical protein